jgi:predicted AlkP superfamily phosphohydrolase/phosphomutase
VVPCIFGFWGATGGRAPGLEGILRRTVRRLPVWVAALATLVCTACNKAVPRDAARDRVLLIGLDGAEWDLIQPLVDAGQLPNLARLMNQGVHGKLRSLEPLDKSPAIWTTIATGKSPDEHGIYSFVNEQSGRPLTRNIRKVRALWNVFSGVGRSVGVVGWLMSWPAETVNGFVVSDYQQYSAKGSVRMNNRTYPPELEPQIASRVLPWETVPWTLVQRFLDAPADTVNMAPEVEHLLRPIKWIAAGDITFARIGQELYRKERPDFCAVYLRGMDMMSHLYWEYMHPSASPPRTVVPAGYQLLAGAVRSYYRFTDELIGPFLDLADERTTIVVVSDHGFQGGGRGIEAHKLDGILVMAGKHVGRGEISGASVYDIAPTVLTLMGLPPAADMRGAVLWSAFDATIPPDRYQQRIATYETGERRADEAPIESPVDEELKERLRSLGYIND